MSYRDDFLKSLLFQEGGKIPFQPGYGRKSTIMRWKKEGLPADAKNWEATYYGCLQAGIEPYNDRTGPGFAVDFNMRPIFEEKVIEVLENSQIVQDWKGNICEIGKEFDVEHLRAPIDFVTRKWLKCPVENRSDWLAMRERYQASDSSRLPENPKALGASLAGRDYPLTLAFSGPYWILREWCGFEQLSMMFYDEPSLVAEMIEFWENYVLDILRRALDCYTPDMVYFSEDMAYKSHPMLSPAMCRQFLLPTWKKWGEFIRSRGVPLYTVDSDGYVGDLIPLWLEAGLNVCDPIEVAAGNDIVALRKLYGRDMAFRGGVDKREMARSGSRIEAEIERLVPVIRSGGFIPGCDHGIPSDVSWPAFLHYLKCLAKYI